MRLLGGERGVALVLALIVLLILSALALSLLSVSAVEPQIAKNLAVAARTRWLAEGGIEVGYAALVAAVEAEGGWSGLLAPATTTQPWVALPAFGEGPLPGLTGEAGSCSVTIRNDGAAGVVILRAACTLGASTRTIEVAVTQQRSSVTMSNWREL